MATVEIQGLRKSYGKTVALRGIDLEIGDGEFFVLLGPSGAGKTTTLKSVAGLQEIDGGRIVIGGRDLTEVEPYRRRVAMAFESYALYPQKTVFENLASPLRSGRTGTYSKSEQAQRIELVTTTLGIAELHSRYPRELSNGQRQRVALGRVLVRPADVYLLDEPLSHLDAKLRAAMRTELKSLGQISSTTAFYVTHDYQEALALGDRIGVLREGRLVQIGTSAQLWSQPSDTFVARSLGQPEINLLDAQVQDSTLLAADGEIRIPAPTDMSLTAGDWVRIGIRPREMTVLPADGATSGPRVGELRVRGRVALAERLGRAMELTVEVGGERLIIVTPSGIAPPEGELTTLGVPLSKVHVFAAGDGAADTPRLGAALSSAAAEAGEDLAGTRSNA